MGYVLDLALKTKAKKKINKNLNAISGNERSHFLVYHYKAKASHSERFIFNRRRTVKIRSLIINND